MTVCSKCIINDNYPGLTFNSKGECSICSSQKAFKPLGEDKLKEIFKNAVAKNCSYDALVPLSGGKDSTYILYLAAKVYKLKVLAMTYDNGFLSKTALENINRAIEITGVKHVFCKADAEVQKKVYRNMLLKSGDICGACDIATISHILKVAMDSKVPLILYGTSPLEEDSFIPDSIQDISRFKYILKDVKDLTKKEKDDYIILKNRNEWSLFLQKKLGKIGLEVRPLFYIDNPSDKEMGEIIMREMGWQEDSCKDFTKHFDCIAEPFTNYVRYKIYGYERHICQYSNMIRRNEITREKAIEMYNADCIEEKPSNYNEILHILNVTEAEMESVLRLKPLQFENHTSKMNKIFISFVKLKQKLHNK